MTPHYCRARLAFRIQIRRVAIYAVVETGGKQYKVSAGQTVLVERLPAEEGQTVELDRVLLLADGEQITVGQPMVAGAKVMATVVEQGRADKLIVFKYKRKTRYQRKTGHRQPFTKLSIDEIVTK